MEESDKDIFLIKIVSQEGTEETVNARGIGDDKFILLENPVFSFRINYGTTVSAKKDEQGEYVLTAVIGVSQYVTRQFLFINALIPDEEAFKRRIGAKIISIGGDWEIVMGGIGFLHIPKSSKFNLDEFFEELGYRPTEIIEDE